MATASLRHQGLCSDDGISTTIKRSSVSVFSLPQQHGEPVRSHGGRQHAAGGDVSHGEWTDGQRNPDDSAPQLLTRATHQAELAPAHAH